MSAAKPRTGREIPFVVREPDDAWKPLDREHHDAAPDASACVCPRAKTSVAAGLIGVVIPNRG